MSTIINRGDKNKNVIIHWVSDKGSVHYSIEGVLTFLPLYSTINDMYDQFDIDIISDEKLISFLGLDFEEDEGLEHEHKNVYEIQVCAGTWKKIIGSNYWTFQKDFEWFMDEV